MVVPSGKGMSSEIPVETSSVAMVVPSSPLPFRASVGAATMTSFSMPSSIFGSAPRPIPGLETTGDHPVGNSNPFLRPTTASASTVNFGPNAGFPTPVNVGPNTSFPTPVNPFVGPHWATNGPFLHTPNAVGPISVPANSVQRPLKFNRTNFKMWQQKMMFFLTVLGFAEYLQQDPPQPNEANDPLVAMVNQVWYHNNYLAINTILEGLGDTLYPVYASAKLAKELWNGLNKKYQAEDAGTKKFIVGKMLDYKMKVGVSEEFQVAAIIHKLPRSWEDFQVDLKLKRTELNLEQLLTRLRIREEGLARRSGGAKANVVEHPSGSSHGGKDKKKMGPKGGVSKLAGKCYNCGITGHRSSDCRKKKPQKGMKKTTEAMCAELENLDLYAVVTEAVQTAIASITHDLENRTIHCKEVQSNGQKVEEIIVSGHTAIPSKEETSSTQQQLVLLDGQDDGQFKTAPEVQDTSLDVPILTEINLLMIDEIEDKSARGDLQKEFELLLPLFEQHINEDFEQALWVIKEAIRSPFVKEKIQKGLVTTLEGKALKAKRDAMKSAQSIRAIKLRCTRHPVLLCCANIDEPIIRTMCAHLIDYE
ncbi:unnamed protein product [Cuscuta campestris]|uniref:CCHC-type domain-containing protein n=1 Tax=Cuscuta campestris TaxID=132261 RepID=A0A484LA60_9ASTE|nr:unnamed protein product [Cuscuta campestris]